ncbi:MAG: hypothetical protein HWD59_13470 [Coxiellaceae bacterium]|nr:MAG: hypothetical protein HWD59_13470 [Coxiellaceae bacterium]
MPSGCNILCTNPEQITGLIKQNGCPAGYGYIPTGTRVEINNYYIPQNQRWYWVYNGNDHCQPLPKMGLSYLNYHATGNYSGDQIITGYGDKNNGETLFSFVFTIPPSNCPDNQCPWYCHNFVGSNPPTIIGCAQDI